MNLPVRLVSDIEVNIAKESYHTMENVLQVENLPHRFGRRTL